MHERTKLLIGEKINVLNACHVAVIGLGGVGGCVFEMLVRAGVGEITAVDGDVFEKSNLNRQLLCTKRNLGKLKATVAVDRANEISNCKVHAIAKRFNETTLNEIFSANYDFIVDCIDSINDKVLLIKTATERNIAIVSAMGAGNRTECDFAITDVFSTTNDALARVMRKKLRDQNVTKLAVACDRLSLSRHKSGDVGSISYAPNQMGCVIAQYVISELIK